MIGLRLVSRHWWLPRTGAAPRAPVKGRRYMVCSPLRRWQRDRSRPDPLTQTRPTQIQQQGGIGAVSDGPPKVFDRAVKRIQRDAAASRSRSAARPLQLSGNEARATRARTCVFSCCPAMVTRPERISGCRHDRADYAVLRDEIAERLADRLEDTLRKFPVTEILRSECPSGFSHYMVTFANVARWRPTLAALTVPC
jgi:hypothetical protein